MIDFLFALFIAPLEWIMRTVLEWGYTHFGSYGAALILMSLVVNTLLLPLYHLAETWQEAERGIQAKMLPQLNRIKCAFQGRERYMMLRTLYRQNNYHPIMAVRTSFGFLIQVPFFFAAFHLLNNYAPLQGVGFGPIQDLGAPDAMLFGINVLPFVMTVINLVSALVYTVRLTSKDKIQLYSIAILFLVLLYSSSAGLVFYWTMNNIFSLVKNIVYEKLGLLSHGITSVTNSKKVKTHNFLQAGSFLSNICRTRVCLANRSLRVINIILIAILVFAVSYIVFKYGIEQQNFSKTIIRLVVIALASFLIVFRDVLLEKVSVWTQGINYQKLPALTLNSLLLVGILLFVYTPLRLMVADTEFQSSTIVAMMIWGAVFTVLIPYSIYKISSQSIKVCLSFGYSVIALIFTVYSFFMVKDYGVLDAFVFEHANKIFNWTYIPIDLIVIVIAVTIVHYAFKERIGTLQKAFSIALVGVMIMTGISALKWQSSPIKESVTPTHTTNKYLRLSQTNPNVLVIMLDMFTGDHIEKIRAERPEVLGGFDGFVWYPDTISAGAGTVLSLPSILAGEEIAAYNLTRDDKKSLEDKIDKSIRNFFQTLDQHNYASKLVTSNSIDFVQEQDYVLHSLVHTLPNTSLQNQGDWVNGLFAIKYALFEATPWSLRKNIYKKGTWGLQSKNSNQSRTHYSVLNRLSTITECDEGESSFITFTNELTHIPWNIDGNTLIPIDKDPYPETQQSIAMVDGVIPEHFYAELASLDRLSVYFDWMKESGVYDNTMIIVVSDHCEGDSLLMSKVFGTQSPTVALEAYPGRPNALLLIKPRNSRGNLEVNSSLMSTTDIRSIVEREVKNKTFQSHLGDRIRYHAIGSWQRKRHPENYYKLDAIWKVKGTKFDRNNWEQIE